MNNLQLTQVSVAKTGILIRGPVAGVFEAFVDLDGFVAGPHQSVKDPLGIGGMRLHELARTIAAPKVTHLKFARS